MQLACFRLLAGAATHSSATQEAPKKLGKGAAPGAAGAHFQELSWLMRTSYISSADARAKPQSQIAQEAGDDGELESLDAQLDAIEVPAGPCSLRTLHCLHMRAASAVCCILLS